MASIILAWLTVVGSVMTLIQHTFLDDELESQIQVWDLGGRVNLDPDETLDIEEINSNRDKFLAAVSSNVEAELKKIGLQYISSSANFILIDMKKDGKIIFQELLNRGVIVRAMGEYGFRNFIRVTIGTQKENKKFIKEVKEIL